MKLACLQSATLALAALPSWSAHADDNARIAAVQDALRAAKAPLHRCWERAAAEDWHVAGEVDLSVIVGGAATILRDATGKPGLADCAAQALGGVTFGKPFTRGETVELPVEFQAEPNVTVRAADVAPVPVHGMTARVLIDEKSAGSTGASLTLVDVPPSATLPPGGAFVVALPGQARLVFYSPAGPEAAFRRGHMPIAAAVTTGTATRGHLHAGEVDTEKGDPDATEICYVVAGHGSLTIDGETYPIDPEMAIHIRPGVTHSLAARTDIDLVRFHAQTPAPRSPAQEPK